MLKQMLSLGRCSIAVIDEGDYVGKKEKEEVEGERIALNGRHVRQVRLLSFTACKQTSA